MSNSCYLFLLIFISCTGEFINNDFETVINAISKDEENITEEERSNQEASDEKQVQQYPIVESVTLGADTPVQNTVIMTNLENRNEIFSKQIKDSVFSAERKSKEIELEIKHMNTKEQYAPGQKHTFSLEVEVKKGWPGTLSIQAQLPANWSIISSSTLQDMRQGSKKLALLTVHIPKNSSPGATSFTVLAIDSSGIRIRKKELNIVISENYDLEVFNISSPQSAKTGEKLETIYGIRNNGNMVQKLALEADGEIAGEKQRVIAPDSLITIIVSKLTDPKAYYLSNVSTFLNVKSSTIEKSFRAYSSTTVFPSKVKKKDAFLRLPLRASLNYNSHTYKNNHFSTISAELTGDGYLDPEKNHHLSFIFRAPEQQNLKRFGVTDQYSLTYNYKSKTTVYLGDHAYFINRLGFDSRYGIGFRIDQEYKDWQFSAYYSKPRLYNFNSSPLYGVKSVYRVNDSLYVGGGIAASSGTLQGASRQIEANPDERGQIATINLDYKNRGTNIEAELSGSFTNKASDFAGYLNLLQSFRNLTYSGTLSLSGEGYFGIMRNSLQYSNSLFYKLNKWDFAAGQNVTRVNRSLDPLFYAAEPYYENFYALIGYRFNKKNYLNIRADIREREDKLEPKSYFYKEQGIIYRYLYTGDRFHLNVNGRIGKTKNLLTENNDYRDSFSHNINGSYRVLDRLALRAGLNHDYNNRYSISDKSTNYTRYQLGFNFSFNQNIHIDATYNSGFSPDENYLRRDFINSNILLNINKNHQFEFRLNYFENAGVVDRKELLALGKYTYTLGIPIKRVLEKGSVGGMVLSESSSISVESIKIISAGLTIATDSKGRFEFNNLPLGKNYLFIDEASLPQGVVVNKKAPLEINVSKNKNKTLSFELVHGGNLNGRVQVTNEKDTVGYQGYIKLKNEEFSYFLESDIYGDFTFKNIVPGTYDIDLVNFKEKDYEDLQGRQIKVLSGTTTTILIPLVPRERKIRFSKKNFILGK